MVFNNRINRFKKLGQALSCLRRYKNDFRIRHEGQRIPHLLLKTVYGFIIFFNGIPFIHRYDHALASFMGYSCNFGILFGNALLGVDYKHYHVGTLHSSHGTDDHIPFQLFFDFIFPAQSCRIDKDIFFSVMHHLRVYGIPGSAGNIGYDYPVFSDKLINNRRFPDIRFSDDGDSGPVVLILRLGPVREMPDDLIQQIADPHPVRR